MFLSNQFWAERKLYEPCGMFTYGHMILLILSLVILSVLLIRSKNISFRKVKKVTRVLAVVITILESIKIYFNFYYGYTRINSWLPMSYCSIFIYSLWLSAYGRGKFKIMGDTFIAGVSMISGGTYLIFPSTALTIYPTWHYLSIYSMFFHTLMVYMGILYIRNLGIILNKKRYKVYIKFYLFFAVIALLFNNYFGSNLMMFRDPANIPLPFLRILHQYNPGEYTFLIFLVYLIIPYWVTAYLDRIIKKVKSR